MLLPFAASGLRNLQAWQRNGNYAATGQISFSVTHAVEGANTAVSVFGKVAAAANVARQSAQTVLESSQAVERALGELRGEVENFLRQVAA